MSSLSQPQDLPAQTHPPRGQLVPAAAQTPGFGDFKGPGFGLVRSFLRLILLVASIMVIVAGFLSWYFGMDVTVVAQGIIEPRHRHLVKAGLTGIIRQIHVRQGQQLATGALLVSLEDIDWRAELHKVEKDLEVNGSQRKELTQQIAHERQILRAQVERARLALAGTRIQLEQVVAEQTLYATSSLLSKSLARRPLEELVPVRLSRALLHQRAADLTLAEKRLGALEGRRQEFQTLDKRREKLLQIRQHLQNRLAQSTIFSPTAGTVLTGDLARRVGDRIQEGETLLEIAQTNDWQAKIMVREIDLPQIAPGQPVRLYVQAFPHMEYKVFAGTVDKVPSAPAQGPADQGTVYPVSVSIEDPQVVDGGRVYSLAYGMNTEAKIVVERGRIWQLLWKKLWHAGAPIGRHDFYRPDATAETDPAHSETSP